MLKSTLVLLIATTSAIQLKREKSYEPGWGQNSGNSYNNGPTTHFAYGKASPYSVTKEDVQVESDA